MLWPQECRNDSANPPSLTSADLHNQRARRRERGHSARAAAVDLRWEADVRGNNLSESGRDWANRGKTNAGATEANVSADCRSDDKTAEDYKLKGGDILHLVLALRGGC